LAGVCATDPAEGGVISPGGVGYDINCGVRLLRTNLRERDVRPKLGTLMDELFNSVPAGVGRGGKYRFSKKELRQLMAEGPRYLQTRGLATEGDIEYTEAHGHLETAQPDNVTDRALERGADQCGTLGAGNHFLEVQVVDEVFDEDTAKVLGLEAGQVCVMIHSGSRGLGYQVCDDALRDMRRAPDKYGIELPDRQLVCAPVHSPEGKHYLGAMGAAANFAWCNRQLLMWQAREAFASVFGCDWRELQMSLLYDVAHNIAKYEEHTTGGTRRKVWVHRKGATRAFPAGPPRNPRSVSSRGPTRHHPGRHGAGQLGAGGTAREHGTDIRHRLPRRRSAAQPHRGRQEGRGTTDRQGTRATRRHRSRAQLERAWPKNSPTPTRMSIVVVDVVHRANLASKVASMRPIGVVKG
jgi:tRNA-splicing ligase RtcB